MMADRQCCKCCPSWNKIVRTWVPETRQSVPTWTSCTFSPFAVLSSDHPFSLRPFLRDRPSSLDFRTDPEALPSPAVGGFLCTNSSGATCRARLLARVTETVTAPFDMQVQPPLRPQICAAYGQSPLRASPRPTLHGFFPPLTYPFQRDLIFGLFVADGSLLPVFGSV